MADLRAIIPVFLSFMLISSPAFATDIHLNFKNGGPEKQLVDIIDTVCNKSRFSGHWAAGDAHIIQGFCVHDASQLKTDFQVLIDGQASFSDADVVEDSVIDIDTGQVSPP